MTPLCVLVTWTPFPTMAQSGSKGAQLLDRLYFFTQEMQMLDFAETEKKWKLTGKNKIGEINCAVQLGPDEALVVGRSTAYLYNFSSGSSSRVQDPPTQVGIFRN